MAQQMAGLSWVVHTSGYEIGETAIDDMPSNATRFEDRHIIRPRDDGKTKPTAPLIDAPDLFLQFLRLQPTHEDLIGFADQHGLLGLRSVGGGELLSEWADQIHLVGGAFWRWEIHEGRVEWDSARAFVGSEFARRQTDPRKRPRTADREVFKRWQSDVDGLKVSLRNQINNVINENMRQFCGYGSSLGDEGNLVWDHWPSSLIGVIWLQCLWHVSGKKKWHVCPRPNCGRWVSNDTTKHGRRKVYCRPACKVAVAKAKARKRNRLAKPRKRRG